MEAYIFQGELESSDRILYTPSGFAKNNLIHLQESGILQASKPHTSGRAGLSSYLFFLVLSGSGQLVYGEQTYTLHKGDCVFIDCLRPYKHITSDDLWSLKWVHFNGPTMNHIYEKYMERGGAPTLSPSSPEAYSRLLTDIHEAAASASHVKDMIICEKLTGLLTMLMQDGWHTEADNTTITKKQDMRKIREYIDENYKNVITLDELSRIFFINKYYMTRIFKAQYGTTIINYLLQVRITKSKHLLRFSDYTMEKIAAECGFPDANYYSRAFKKIEGISPSIYRKSW